MSHGLAISGRKQSVSSFFHSTSMRLAVIAAIALVAGVADGVEDQFAFRDFVDLVLMQELSEIEAERRFAKRRRQRLKGIMRIDEMLRLHRHLGAFGVRFIAGGVRSR